MLELDNLSKHLELLPERISQAINDADKTVATLARATPADLISIIPGVEASVFWKDNFQNEIVVGESRVKVPFVEIGVRACE